MLTAAQRRSEPVDHILFHGPPGTGKTTLSWIIAQEMGVPLRELSAPAIRRPGDLAAVLVSLVRGHVLFLDEIHALATETAEMLYSGLEDFRISLITGRGEESTAHTRSICRVSRWSARPPSSVSCRRRCAIASGKSLRSISTRSPNCGRSSRRARPDWAC